MRLLGLMTFLLACGPKAAVPSNETAPQREALAPLPYTADQIRDASPEGRQIVFRVWDGDEASWQRLTFKDVGSQGATILGAAWREGQQEPPSESGESTWEDLREHASFPADRTTVDQGHEVTVPAGSFDATRYTVTDAEGSTYFFFARALPGPPVLMVVERDGNTRVMEMVQSEVAE